MLKLLLPERVFLRLRVDFGLRRVSYKSHRVTYYKITNVNVHQAKAILVFLEVFLREYREINSENGYASDENSQ